MPAISFTIHDNTLHLGAMIWAAVGKDPGLTPRSLLELLKRRGRYRPEDFKPLMLSKPLDLPALKERWLKALAEAESFISERPQGEIGCLYWSKTNKQFVAPDMKSFKSLKVVPHYGRPGGILPIVK